MSAPLPWERFHPTSGGGRHEAPDPPVAPAQVSPAQVSAAPAASPGWEITGSTAQGKQLIIADAKSRSWRTLLVGLSTDLFAALLAALAQVSNLDPGVGKSAWAFVGVLVGKSLLQAGVSFFARLRVEPTITVAGDKYALAAVPVPRKVGP